MWSKAGRSPASSNFGLPVSVDEPDRIDSYVKLGSRPSCRCSSKTTAAAACARCSKRCAARAARSSTCSAPASTTSRRPRRCATTSPKSRTLTLAELVGPPLLTELGRSVTRQRVQQYQRYMDDADRVLILTHNDPDPDAMASGLALRTLLRRTRQTAVIGCLEPVTRPENLRMVKLLDLKIETAHAGAVQELRQDRARRRAAALLPGPPAARRPGDRSPSRAIRLQRDLQGHPPRLRLDVDDPHRAPARRRHGHLGAHRDGDALRDQVRHAVLQPPRQPRRHRRVLVPLSARRRHDDPQDGGRRKSPPSASTT